MPEPEERSSAGPIIAVMVGLAVVAAGVATVVLRWTRAPAAPAPTATPAVTAEPTAEPPLGEEAAKAAPPLELPALDDSDALVAKMVGEISSRPELLSMLLTDGHVRRFVATIDNVAAGQSPRPHLKGLVPQGRYDASETSGGIVASPASFARYDAAADLFCSIDPAGAARLYRQMKPLVQDAYKDLGYPGKDFDEPLRKAIRRMLATPVPDEPIMLGTRGSTYVYADPQLEALSPAEKHLVRMGPANQRRVKDHLRKIAAALGMK